MRLQVLVVGALAALLVGCGAPPVGIPPPALVTITVRYSHFEPGSVTVRAGQPVTFTLRSEDPIEHEWIVGPPHVHAAHRTGTEPHHDTRPDEITLPAYATRTTTLTFDRPGDYLFICHLPGHEAYGMTGRLRVLPG
jgi:uncharacterized cupredoxin-like copper-binding protein